MRRPDLWIFAALVIAAFTAVAVANLFFSG
jgi:hypothetical protein